jgi:flagellar basal-body rod protein FlgF/flagellar basal-body rod protein FlgG
MDSGIYAACAGLVARTQQLDTVASNLANSSTAGFHGQQVAFGSVLAQAAHHGTLSALNQVTNSFGILSGTHLDETQGTITHTGNQLDVALEGPGYLKVQTAKGAAYTRNGSLQLSSTGRLTTTSGDPVLGQSGPITLPSGAVTISSDGTISSAGAIVGKLQVVDFAPGTVPVSQGGGYYNVPAATKEQPVPGTGLLQGSLESSNTNSIDGVVDLVTAQRNVETMRHVLTMLDADMDKTAVQDLPRVS